MKKFICLKEPKKVKFHEIPSKSRLSTSNNIFLVQGHKLLEKNRTSSFIFTFNKEPPSKKIHFPKKASKRRKRKYRTFNLKKLKSHKTKI